MNDAMALRLDEETRHRLAKIAKRRGTTRSAVVRQAISELIRREPDAVVSPYNLVKDLIGSLDGGDPRRAEGGGRGVAETLRKKRRRT